MPPKRPRDSVNYLDESLVKRQRTDTELLLHDPPPSLLANLLVRLGFGAIMGSSNNGATKSRSQMRADTFKGKNARRINGPSREPQVLTIANGGGVPMSEVPKPGSVLAAIYAKDRETASSSSSSSTSKPAQDGQLNGFPLEDQSSEAGPSHNYYRPPTPNSQNDQPFTSQSPARRLLGAAKSLLYLPSTSLSSYPVSASEEVRLFDEGRLKPNLGTSASAPIELDSSSEDESEAGPSSHASNVAPPSPSPIPTPTRRHSHGRRPPPSKPILETYERPERSYTWLDRERDPELSDALSSSSSASLSAVRSKRHRERRTHTSHLRKRSSNLRRSIGKEEERKRRLIQAVKKTTGGGSQEDQRAGEKVISYLTAPHGRKAERILESQTQEGKPSKEFFASLLNSFTSQTEKSFDHVLNKKINHKPFSIERNRRTADQAKKLASLQRTSTIDDLVEKYKKQRLEDEAKVQARLRPSVPTRMAPARAKIVAKHLQNPRFSSKFVNQMVESASLKRLTGLNWLDDEIINFYGAMLLARSQAAQEKGDKSLPDVYYHNSFFYKKLSENGYDAARLSRWTKRAKVDIFAKDLVIFPINLGDLHWVAAALNMKHKRLEFYDSMGDRGNTRRNVFADLWDYLEKEHKDKKGTEFDSTGWTESFMTDTPQQDNGSDCGVFTCQTLEALSRGLDLTQAGAKGFEFSAKNMPYIRQLMILEIGQAALEARWPKEE